LKIGIACTHNLRMASSKVADWDANKYSKDASFIFKDSATVLDLLNPQPGPFRQRNNVSQT